MATSAHRGWYRPRGLPHFDSPQVPQFITFRLAHSLPRDVLQARRDEAQGAYRRLERALDAGFGACWLARPAFADLVIDALLHESVETYRLHAFVVMPNHVHVLTTFAQGAQLGDAVRKWKSYSAKRINEALGRTGALWQRDYFDRFVRDERQFEAVRAYIENNPVAARLAATAADWRFSSARGYVGREADAPRDG